MGAGRTSPTTAPAEPSRLPSMEGAPSTGERAVHGGAGRPWGSGPSYSPWASWSRQAGPSTGERGPGAPCAPDAERAKAGPPTGERVVRRQPSPVRICWAGTAGAAPRIRRPGPWPGHWHRPRRELPRHTPGGSRRCRPTRPWRAPAARHTPGRVELTMSPQLTLCELSSHELSSGGFCQAELASCEPEWILLSRPGRLFWDRPSGAGGTPGAARVGVVSKSATKAPRGGIDREEKRGISTILFRRSGSIRAFVADLDNWRRRGPRGEGVARLGEVHDVGAGAPATPVGRAVADRAGAPFDRAGPARASPSPRAGAPIREIAT